MRTYKIYLIRHGLTNANFEGRYIGKTDLDLNEAGIEEILKLKEEYEYPNVGRVYTSPLKRAIETARLIYPEITPFTVNDLREYEFGNFENKTVNELENDEKFKEWIKSNQSIKIDGAEDMASFNQRIISGLDSVIKDMMTNRISDAALITHSGVIMSLLANCGFPKMPPLSWNVESGKGYTLLINTSLWANSNNFEIFTPVPYGYNKDSVMLDYQKDFDDPFEGENIE